MKDFDRQSSSLHGPSGGLNAAEAGTFLSASRMATDYFLPFQLMPIPVQSMGPDALLRAVNKAWVTFTGYSQEEVIGHSFAEFLEPASATLYRDKAVPEFLAKTADLESRSVEYRLIKKSGEIADIVLTARPNRDPLTGRFLYSLSVITDVTARNQAEAALRQSQKLEALGNLTSGVAHDFNNLLMIIQGSLQLLMRRLPADDTRAGRLVDTALQGTRRGAALTSRLLSFARQQELAPRSVDPHALLTAVRPMLAQSLGPSILLEEDLPSDIWHLQADPNQLDLALLNIASNARDAMPDGGKLRVSARNITVGHTSPDLFIELQRTHLTPPGDYVVLSLEDTGVGMDEAALARAVDPFFTTKGPHKGTGLGLSMVQGFAAQSGGALRITSRLGQGTAVELWLPRSTAGVDAGDAKDALPPPYSAAPMRSLKILLVDDDPLVVASTTSMLEEIGHGAVSVATSAQDGLALLRQNANFDLLLTDHMMPGMSGVQLAEHARALHPALPIVIASGFVEVDGLSGSTWQRLRKPYTLAELSSALAAVSLTAKRRFD